MGTVSWSTVDHGYTDHTGTLSARNALQPASSIPTPQIYGRARSDSEVSAFYGKGGEGNLRRGRGRE